MEIVGWLFGCLDGWVLVAAVISFLAAILFYLAYHDNETPVADSVEIVDCHINGQLRKLLGSPGCRNLGL